MKIYMDEKEYELYQDETFGEVMPSKKYSYNDKMRHKYFWWECDIE